MAGAQEYAHPEYLADTGWLADHLDDPNVRVVDTDVADQYRRAHISGAVMVQDNYEKDPDTNRVHILGPDAFAQMAQSLGIGDDTLVVSYDNSRGLYAARLWWALNYYGHTNARVLNGGWHKWLSEGRSASTVSAKAGTVVTFTPNVNPSLIVTTDQLKEDYNKSGVAVWDVRGRDEYTGENKRGNKRGGHAPGAVHLEWLELIDDRTHLLKPAAEVRRILEDNGITPDKRIHVH